MKRISCLLVSAALLVSLASAAAGAEPPSTPEGLQIDWYPQYETISRRYGTDVMVVQDGSGLYALADLYGNPLTDFVFDAIGAFEDGTATAVKSGRYGRIDQQGNTVVSFEYDSDWDAENHNAVKMAQQDGVGLFGVEDADGNVLAAYQYWNARPFKNGFAAVQNSEQKWGYVDETGKEVIPCRYYSGGVDDFEKDGLAIVYGTVFTGEGDGLRVVSQGYNVIDATGRELLAEPSYQKPWRAGQGLIGFTDGTSRVGFLAAETGEVIIPCRYEYATDPKGQMDGNQFNDYGAATVLDGETGRWGVIDTRGSVVVPFVSCGVVLFDADGVGQATLVEGDYESGDFEYVSRYYDSKGNLLENYVPTWERDDPEYHEGLAMVSTSGKHRYDGGQDDGSLWGFVDEAGEEAVPCVFDAVGEFDRGFASVRRDGVYGMLKNPLNKDAVSDWARAGVARAAELGLVTERTSGYDTYAITRLQFAELAVNLVEKAAGKPLEPAEAGRFTDTEDMAARKAAAAGIVSGTGDGSTFSPGALITREQMAAMLYRAVVVILWERDGLGFTPVPTDLSAYTDGDQVADWAGQAVSQCVVWGVLKGTSQTTISPQDHTTVEQGIIMALRAYEL